MVCSSKNFRAARGLLSGLGPLEVVLHPAVRITNRDFPIAYFEKSSYLCAVVRIVGNAEVQPMNVNHRLKA